MAKDILMYGYIGEYCARSFFEQIEKAYDKNENEELNFRVNTDGGNPFMGWGMLKKMQEINAKKLLIDGAANSMGAFACLYVDEAEAVDTAEFCIHRAAHWYEANPEYFDDGERKRLANINAKLKKAVKARVDVAKFEEITGKTVDEIFSMDGRVAVSLTAEQAKECGWITEVVKLTPKRRQTIEAYKKSAVIEANVDSEEEDLPARKPAKASKEKETSQPTEDMTTLEELKTKFPALYNAAIEEGTKAGVKKENDRIMSFMAYAAVDPKRVSEAIKNGEEFSTRHMAEFNAIMMSPDHLAKIQKDSAAAVTTAANEGGANPAGSAAAGSAEAAKKKEIEDFTTEVAAFAGIKKKEAKAA